MLNLMFRRIFRRKRKIGSHIREFVFGFNDGLVTTFTVVASFSGAQISSLLIIFAGLVNALSDGLSMALGAWLSTKSEIETVKKYEIDVKNKLESEEGRKEIESKLLEYFNSIGMGEEEGKKIIKKLIDKPTKLAEFMASNIEHISTPEAHTPLKDSIVMFFSFILGSLFPLFPYFFPINNQFRISLALALLAAFAVGVIKTKITGRNKLKSGLESLTVAAILLILSYSLGVLFKTFVL